MRDQQAQHQPGPERHVEDARARHGHAGRGHHAGDETLPGLAGADLRRELVPAEQAAAEIRADVRRRDQHQQVQQQPLPVGLQRDQVRQSDAGRHQHHEARDGRRPAPARLRAQRQPEEGDDPPGHRQAQLVVEPARIARQHLGAGQYQQDRGGIGQPRRHGTAAGRSPPIRSRRRRSPPRSAPRRPWAAARPGRRPPAPPAAARSAMRARSGWFIAPPARRSGRSGAGGRRRNRRRPRARRRRNPATACRRNRARYRPGSRAGNC